MSDIEIARAATAQPIGEIMAMPGLPRVPAADKIHIDDGGLIQGLF